MDIGEEVDKILKADKTMIHIDIGVGPPGFFDVSKSVVVTWGIIAFCLVLCLFLTSGLRIDHISRKQAAIELAIMKLRDIVEGMLGPEGRPYAEYIMTVLVFLGISNMIGLIGLTPPTMDLNVTAALALMSIVLVELAGIRQKGMKLWLSDFADPIPVILPMNILELGIRPLSLCMRLFGNVLGATVIMEMIKVVIPVLLPALLSMYFDVFDGLIQAYVFCFLTSLYIAEATEEKERETAEEKAERKRLAAEARAARRAERARKRAEEEKFDAMAFYRRLLMLPPKESLA
ncbi:MAG: F0F1 ATP synthase subunit A [Lachnospiraceae bacterium]|nr:F0F1 ATP synthase subunit A [Lachnospiraceae bacterium]